MVAWPRMRLKLLRDLKQARLQFGAVTLIVLLGVAIFIGAYSAFLNLDLSYKETFDRLHMADYWISIDSVSQKTVGDLNKIPGVHASGRIIGEVAVDLGKDTGEKVTARVVSLPADKEPTINMVQIEQGTYFTEDANREIIVQQKFADYHKFEPGDMITLELNGVRANFRVAGVATSPEFIWVAKSEREPSPSPRTFGLVFIAQHVAEQMFDMQGAYSEIVMEIDPGIDHSAVMSQVRDLLRDNGILRVTSKDDLTPLGIRRSETIKGVESAYVTALEDQISNRLLKQDLVSFASMAFLFPMLFLSMASLTIYVLLSRMIESQRVQIGIMRAIGYGRFAVMRHYIGFGLVPGLVGSALGAIIGQWMANGWTTLYVAQLNLPFTVTAVHWDVLIAGVLTGTFVALIAGVVPSWTTLRIRPAEAMRPPVPVTGNRILLKISGVFLGWLPSALKLPIRNILRNLRRSLFMAVGVASAVIITLVTMSFVDALDKIFQTEYVNIQHYDARIVFQTTGTVSTATYISHLDGITRAEPSLDVAYRIRNGDVFIDSSVTGLAKDSTLYGLVKPDGTMASLNSDGVLLPSSFKEKLGVDVGDTVLLEPIMGTIGSTEKRVSDFLETPIGARAFMPLEEIQKALRQPGAASGVYVTFAGGEPSKSLLKRLYDIPEVTSVELVSDSKALIDEQMGFFWAFIGVMLAMGGTLGAAIIFNGVTVNVLQRTREIAIIRAIGMSKVALGALVTLENLIIGLIGVAIGLPAGYQTAVAFMNSMSSSTEDIFSFSVAMTMRSYYVAVAFALVVLLVAQIPALRHVTGLSLATATKEWAE